MAKSDPEPEYEPGDKVKRKSDGVRMTVVDVYGPTFHHRVRCVWGEGDAECDIFHPRDVEPVSDVE